MSKEPEVGDVWVSEDKTKVRIIFVGKYEIRFHYARGDYLHKESEAYSYFLKNYKYLGKSKVNIKELFDVEVVDD